MLLATDLAVLDHNDEQYGTGAEAAKRDALLYRLTAALFGPASTGPYGPPTAPPVPKRRDRWGHLVKGRSPFI